jgi:hypothetical protein
MASAAQNQRTPARPKPAKDTRHRLQDRITRKFGILTLDELQGLDDALELKVRAKKRGRSGVITVRVLEPGSRSGAATHHRHRHRAPGAREAEQETPSRFLGGAGMGTVLSHEEGMTRLDAMTVDDTSADWAKSDLLRPGVMAKQLEVSRTTLDSWRKQGMAIALRKGPRNYIYPAAQFVGLSPVEGIKPILEHFATPEDAWAWLVTDNPHTSGKPPLERLRRGKVDEVVRAAEGALDFA